MIGKFLKKNYQFLGKANKYYFMDNGKFNSGKDYYKILGVNKDSPISQIKQSYFKLAKQYHPDVNKGNQAKFKQISQAYGVLSDKELRQQYDSARLFGSFASRMGSKAQSGQYQYQSYQSQYDNMTESQKQQLRRQLRRKMRSISLFLGGFILFWIFFSRKPHRYYNEVNGILIPFQPIMNPIPGNYPPQGGYGSPYGNQYPYQPSGYSPTPQSTYNPKYGNNPQYGNTSYQNNQYSSPTNNIYNPSNFRNPGQQNSQSEYAVLHPQTIQPYPNSPYAPKTMQANYQPNYKPQAPEGLK